MTVTSPNTENFSVSNPVVEIAGVVQDTTAGIYVNDEAVPVDETGSSPIPITITGRPVPPPSTWRSARTATPSTARPFHHRLQHCRRVAPLRPQAAELPRRPHPPRSGMQIHLLCQHRWYKRPPTRSISGCTRLGGGDKVYVISAGCNGWYKIAWPITPRLTHPAGTLPR